MPDKPEMTRRRLFASVSGAGAMLARFGLPVYCVGRSSIFGRLVEVRWWEWGKSILGLVTKEIK